VAQQKVKKLNRVIIETREVYITDTWYTVLHIIVVINIPKHPTTNFGKNCVLPNISASVGSIYVDII
jgi:hypothetical protein